MPPPMTAGNRNASTETMLARGAFGAGGPDFILNKSVLAISLFLLVAPTGEVGNGLIRCITESRCLGKKVIGKGAQLTLAITAARRLEMARTDKRANAAPRLQHSCALQFGIHFGNRIGVDLQ